MFPFKEMRMLALSLFVILSMPLLTHGSKPADAQDDWEMIAPTSPKQKSKESESQSSVNHGYKIITTNRGANDKEACIWDTGTGKKPLTRLQGHRGVVLVAALNHDYSKAVTGSHDRTARIWDAMTGESLQTLFGHHDIVESASFNHDGYKVATGGDDTARIWDVATGTQLCILNIKWPHKVAFNNDGTQLIGCGYEGTHIWDAHTGKLLHKFDGQYTR